MKIYVVCDLEGTAGVIDHRQQCWFDGAYYPQARRLATLELNALVEGALAGGATEVVAWDGHGPFPGGLDVELLHPACQMVMGAGDGGPAGLDGSFAALFQCGLHGRVGAEKGVLAHSFMGNIAGYWVNGQPMGEIGMNCLTAGEVGVPCVFVGGDRAAALEAEALVPGIETAIVKEGLASAASTLAVAPARSLAPARAREVIRTAAARAMQKIGQIAPYRLTTPYTLRTQFAETEMAEQAAARPGMRQIDACTVEEQVERLHPD